VVGRCPFIDIYFRRKLFLESYSANDSFQMKRNLIFFEFPLKFQLDNSIVSVANAAKSHKMSCSITRRLITHTNSVQRSCGNVRNSPSVSVVESNGMIELAIELEGTTRGRLGSTAAVVSPVEEYFEPTPVLQVPGTENIELITSRNEDLGSRESRSIGLTIVNDEYANRLVNTLKSSRFDFSSELNATHRALATSTLGNFITTSDTVEKTDRWSCSSIQTNSKVYSLELTLRKCQAAYGTVHCPCLNTT